MKLTTSRGPFFHHWGIDHGYGWLRVCLGSWRTWVEWGA